ncbi:LysR family transcriptional regulator [Vibrio echinoideorum]|uniref:LysR family transcriptional regulator n=1 Tax=Vibrio echinoideorum TaxID=2100116 RepID=A0ABU9FN87_9VIBR|nr:LysR family transcriptional regulator [Vibrio splendidus ZS-139]
MKYSDFNLIPTFVAIMEERSFSGAAKRLGVSQSAISQSATRLKTLFDDPLFLRESHGITPTKLALSIYPTLATAIEEIKLTTPYYRAFDPESCDREFVVSALSVFGLSILPVASKIIGQVAPLASVKAEAHVHQSDTTNMLRHKFDITLDVNYGQYPQLCSEVIMKNQLNVICREDHPRLTGPSISATEFLNERHVTHTVPGQQKSYLLDKGLKAEELLRQRDIAWHSNSITEMLPIIEQNDYIGIFPSILLEKHFSHFNLKTLKCDFLPDWLSISMFWHASRNNDPSHQWLRSVFSETSKQLSLKYS